MDATAPPLPIEPPPSPPSITPQDYVENEGEYLRLVNELKVQFDEYKITTDRNIRRLNLRIGRLVEQNASLEWSKLKLTNMFLKLSERHYTAGTSWN